MSVDSGLKGYIHYKKITCQNVSSEAQVKACVRHFLKIDYTSDLIT